MCKSPGASASPPVRSASTSSTLSGIRLVAHVFSCADGVNLSSPVFSATLDALFQAAVALELSSPSLRITAGLLPLAPQQDTPNFLHAKDTASKKAVPPPLKRLSIPSPSSTGSALKS